MYRITRIIDMVVQTSNDWEKITKKRAKESFLLTNEEFNALKNMHKEYNYAQLGEKTLYVDRHPSKIQNRISNTDFIRDYSQHLSNKHYVLYEYEMVDDV